MRQYAEATLGAGSLRQAVKLPEGEDLSEWLAVNGECLESERGLVVVGWHRTKQNAANGSAIVGAVVDFYNQINLLVCDRGDKDFRKWVVLLLIWSLSDHSTAPSRNSAPQLPVPK